MFFSRFQAFALSISFAVIGINLWFAIDYIHAQFGFSPLVFVAMAVPFAFYIFFIGYLLVTSLVAMELIKASFCLPPPIAQFSLATFLGVVVEAKRQHKRRYIAVASRRGRRLVSKLWQQRRRQRRRRIVDAHIEF